jgi:RNA polymerase sigma factor (sigma-70 family)
MDKLDQQKRIADFFRSERRRLIGYVRRWIDETAAQDGEDIVQDVALNIFNRADVTLPIDYLSAYIYRALRNRIIDVLRRPQNAVVSLDSEEADDPRSSLAKLIHDWRPGAHEELERLQLHNTIYAAIDALTEEQKAIVVETEFEGRSFRELAEEWNIPIGTLLARKSRALQNIKKTLEKGE